MHTKRITRIILFIFYLSFVIIPLLNVFVQLDLDKFNEIIFSTKFFKTLGNSLTISIISTIIVLILSYLAAYAVERTAIKGKSVFKLIFIIFMLIPSVSNAIGLIILFGNNGLITKLLNYNIELYGAKGVILGEILYAFPVAFLMFDDIMQYESYILYEEAKVLGISKWNIFKDITFAFIKKPLISIMFCVFTLIITDYGIPLIVGGKFMTVPILMYQEVLGRLDFRSGICYSIILLMLALISFVFDIFNKEKKKNIKLKYYALKDNNITFYYVYCIIISICIISPLLSFIFVIDIQAFKKILIDNFFKCLFNSLIISFVSSFVGTFLAFITAYISVSKFRLSNRIIHILAIIPIAIPGLVLGLSYTLFFKSTIIYGTLIIIIIVNIVHFISSPYLMAYNSLSKVNPNIGFSSKILGISEYSYIKDIIVPLNSHTIIEMFSFYFVNCMMTISAVSFLSNFNTKPLSLLINQFQEQMQLGASALIVLVILIVNLLLKFVLGKICSK